MSEKRSEKSEMSSVEFAQCALRERVSPPSVGSVKARLRHAARSLGWSQNRVKDIWYADPRISISADEIRKIEETTGLHYGREGRNRCSASTLLGLPGFVIDFSMDERREFLHGEYAGDSHDREDRA